MSTPGKTEFLDLDSTSAGAATQGAQASVSEIRQALYESGEFFIEFFLGEELAYEVPQFHIECWDLMSDEEKDRILLAMPRDHAKTTLAKLKVLWYFMFTKRRFGVYLSNTSPIAKNACRDILGFLKCPNYVSVFGDIVIEKESETDGLWIFRMNLGTGESKRCIVRSAGANQQMRGINIDNQRPDIAVVDDVEDMANTESPAMQRKLDRWVFGTFLKALAKNHKILWLGNMLQKTSLLARLSLRPRWNPVVFGCLVHGANGLESLWPDRWPLDMLLEDYREYADLGLIDTWMCEMMNMPGHGQNGFNQDQLRYAPQVLPEELEAAFITVDPAFGLDANKHDKTAIVVHGIRADGVTQVLAYEYGNMDEQTMFNTCLELALRWRAWVWGIESVAAQSVLFALFEIYAQMAQVQGQFMLVPLRAGRGDPKAARIKAWVNSFAAGVYVLTEYDYSMTQQILGYDLSKKDQVDDLIDSGAYGLQMLNNYTDMILTYVPIPHQSRERGASQFGMEVASA